MEDVAGWVAPIATMIAAMMTAANLGARFTGWGFIVFTIGSIGWCTVAISTGQQNLLFTNVFLTLVNLVGIWRWLGRQARYEDGGKKAAARSQASHVPTLYPVGSFAGSPLLGRDGDKIGTVVESMMRCSDLGLAYVVVSDGGVGGVGETLYALDPGEIRVSEEAVSCAFDSDTLRAMAPLDPEKWPVALAKTST